MLKPALLPNIEFHASFEGYGSMTISSKLTRLRDIGWSLWDPIGLLQPGQTWRDAECQPFSDEYDHYLFKTADLLRQGFSDAEVIEYLVDIETNHMAFGAEMADTRQRLRLVVNAIRADETLRG